MGSIGAAGATEIYVNWKASYGASLQITTSANVVATPSGGPQPSSVAVAPVAAGLAGQAATVSFVRV
jgi:hypothetical protein